MECIVMKFGGTSICNNEKRLAAFKHIKRELEAGYKVVVVVSAMGRMGESYATDTLKELVSSQLSKQENDRLLACGEIISSIVMSDFLRQQGVRAIALSPHDIGIKTDDTYSNANVQAVDVSLIKAAFDEYDVVIAPGFVGTTQTHNIATLGRGGSDTTAVVLGAQLQATYVEIYSDVAGVMTADPKLVKDAKVLDEISYEMLVLLAARGAKVIHSKAIEYAKQQDVKLRLRQTTTEAVGTNVVHQAIKTLSLTSKPNYVRYGIVQNISFSTPIPLIKHGAYWYTEQSNVKDIEAYLNKVGIEFLKKDSFVRISVIEQQVNLVETTYFVESSRLEETMCFLHNNLV